MSAFVQQSFVLLVLAYTLGLLTAAWLVRVFRRRPAAHARRAATTVEQVAPALVASRPLVEPVWEHSFVDLS